MYMMWYIIIMSALFYITVVLPFGLFYSETDEEKEFVSKYSVLYVVSAFWSNFKLFC
jgi:hypothetical protein